MKFIHLLKTNYMNSNSNFDLRWVCLVEKRIGFGVKTTTTTTTTTTKKNPPKSMFKSQVYVN